MGIFASCPSKSRNEYGKALISFTALEQEAALSAAEHEQLIEYVLPVFGKSVVDVSAPLGDDFAKNKATNAFFDVGSIWCLSHRFHLAVKNVLSEY